MRRIVIDPVDSAIHLLNNRGLIVMSFLNERIHYVYSDLSCERQNFAKKHVEKVWT